MKVALRGDVVTMDDAFTVVPRGVVYADENGIVSVQPEGAPPPSSHANVAVTQTGGTIYPGLIELHNHLPYNVLELGRFAKKYDNRDQWRTGDYRNQVTGPLEVLNRDPALVAALVRFVECKNVVAGVTTSQGITLASNAGVQSMFGGLARNVEETGDKKLPDAATHVADLADGTADAFKVRLDKAKSAILLHLAEGTDLKTQKMWKRLQRPSGDWAITPALAGIHGVRLADADWKIYGDHGGTLVWSPASNLLLYGETAKVDRAIAHGVVVSLGSDWSFSGSKNLLAELKVARAVSDDRGWGLDARTLVSMVTRSPARALRWAKLGSLEKGKYLDAVVVRGTGGDAYARLVDASEKDVLLTMIGAAAQFGTPALMSALSGGATRENVRIGGLERSILVRDPSMSTGVATVPLSEAVKRLKKAMKDLPTLAHQPALHGAVAKRALRIVLDEDMAPVFSGYAAAAAPLALASMKLDALTVADDATYWDRIRHAGNLPASIGTRLPP